MSLNDKVKVIWKTTCQWRDHAHWPKRRDIKLPESETGTLDQLKPGDSVKVKFGARWYNAEMAERWEPKSKKGTYFSVFGILTRNIVASHSVWPYAAFIKILSRFILILTFLMCLCQQ